MITGLLLAAAVYIDDIKDIGECNKAYGVCIQDVNATISQNDGCILAGGIEDSWVEPYSVVDRHDFTDIELCKEHIWACRAHDMAWLRRASHCAYRKMSGE